MQEVIVNSPNVKYTDSHIETKYEYHTTKVETVGNKLYASPLTDSLHIRTGRKPATKLGVLLVGWGGNNGTTLTAALLANRRHLTWPTRSTDAQAANWYGSLTQAATVRLGNTVRDDKEDNDDVGKGVSSEVYVPLGALVPLAEPNSLVVGGWDISGADMAAAMDRARVLEPALRDQLREEMAKMKPMRGLYDRDFIAANQSDRADNVMSPSASRWEQVTQLVNDIRNFRRSSGCDDIIVVWTANTERFSAVLPGVHDTQDGLTAAIQSDHKEVSPSTLYAYAAIEAGCLAYINGSPQNTFVPGVIEFAESRKVFIAGDDFKSGQTKIKSVLVDFLVGAGIKPVSIVSYNHLGNNDGKNLSAPQQFRSKEISKSNVVDDMVASNPLLYAPGESPDHCVVIKYVPYVGDSKRALDEYTSEIMLGGHNTLVVHNTCEDSLLAAPIILDLIVLAEFATRVQFKQEHDTEYTGFHPVLSLLSYLCKAPLVPQGSPVVNALFKQRACIENVLRACVGLAPNNSMHLEHKVPTLMKKHLVEDVKQCNGHADKKRKVLNGK